MRELLARTDSRELTEWEAYERLEPFGERRADKRAALVAWMMSVMWRGKSSEKFQIGDFMLENELDIEEPMTPEEMMAAFAGAVGKGR